MFKKYLLHDEIIFLKVVTSKMCSKDLGMMPLWVAGSLMPCMEKLLPQPVCPYAKMVPL